MDDVFLALNFRLLFASLINSVLRRRKSTLFAKTFEPGFCTREWFVLDAENHSGFCQVHTASTIFD